MPREESIAETGKQRSLRVPLDHYRQPNRLVRGKYWLTTVACIAAIVYAVWLMMPTAASQQQISPGPLAAVHASWNSDCAACHQDFQPLRSDAVSLVGVIRGDEKHREALDQSCIKCHNTPAHHASAKADDVSSCATCHREHRGAGADIVRASDAACLGCHRGLESHRNGASGLIPAVADVSAFRMAAEGAKPPHPEFRSLVSDPGNIKFNHWLHLQPGIAPAESKKKFKLSDVPDSLRKQYATYEKPDGLVQLDCAACHEPDRTGAYMRPIAFEQHCQACHPLNWRFGEDQPVVEVPHGLTSERLGTVLDGLILSAEAKVPGSGRAAVDESGNEPLIPGKTLGRNLAQKIGSDLLGNRNAAARAIGTKCQECHIVDETRSKSTIDLPDFLSSNIPAVWLKHAKFDHRAHRHVECRQCHAAAFAYEQREKPQFVAVAAGASAARDHEQVMIAGMEDCAKCHAPARGSAGGARFDCAECHRYHGGDAQLSSSPSSSEFSLQGSSLKAQAFDARSSPGTLSSPIIHLASFRVAATNSPVFTGTSSCASTGCHGSAGAKSPTWQTSFTMWASHDPHAMAYEVLWTFRGREMTRLLNQKNEPLGDSEHFREIEHRCVGCHATPAPVASANTAHYALGVQCESCHGAAGKWVNAHYQTGFRRDAVDFVDTKDLGLRAQACMKCHVGPSDAAGLPQAVDHDLIAAGHPRLSFEFRSYMESLPAHWDRQKDKSLFPQDYHVQAWRAGQSEMVAWRNQHQIDSTRDFAQLECSACHHGLSDSKGRQGSERSLALPRVKLSLAPPANKTLPMPERLDLVRQILLEGARNDSWDDALNGYLAARAITADEPIRKMVDWNAILVPLREYLSRDSFPVEVRSRRNPSPYDSPSEFDPIIWERNIAPVIETLNSLKSTVQ